MQKLGIAASKGFSYKNLISVSDYFTALECTTELIDLKKLLSVSIPDEAYVLVIRKGLSKLLPSGKNEKDFFMEQQDLEYNKKAIMYGCVVNKHARHNICFSYEDQEPDYEHGKVRVISFNNEKINLLNHVKNRLISIVGPMIKDIVAEGNYYYDIRTTGIGWPGDSERAIVIGIRSGASMPLHYRWYYKNEVVSGTEKIMLNDGDIYFMSEKAVGKDWKKKNIYTLRHSAGAEKYIS